MVPLWLFFVCVRVFHILSLEETVTFSGGGDQAPVCAAVVFLGRFLPACECASFFGLDGPYIRCFSALFSPPPAGHTPLEVLVVSAVPPPLDRWTMAGLEPSAFSFCALCFRRPWSMLFSVHQHREIPQRSQIPLCVVFSLPLLML